MPPLCRLALDLVGRRREAGLDLLRAFKTSSACRLAAFHPRNCRTHPRPRNDLPQSRDRFILAHTVGSQLFSLSAAGRVRFVRRDAGELGDPADAELKTLAQDWHRHRAADHRGRLVRTGLVKFVIFSLGSRSARRQTAPRHRESGAPSTNRGRLWPPLHREASHRLWRNRRLFTVEIVHCLSSPHRVDRKAEIVTLPLRVRRFRRHVRLPSQTAVIAVFVKRNVSKVRAKSELLRRSHSISIAACSPYFAHVRNNFAFRDSSSLSSARSRCQSTASSSSCSETIA